MFPVEHTSTYAAEVPIADILQRVMDARGLNPTSLARESGVPQPTIRNIVNGTTANPEQPTVEKLATFLGVSPAQLRGELPLDVDHGLPPGKYVYPKAYDVVAGKGSGRFNEHPHLEVAGTIPIPADLIARRGWRVDRLAVVKTDGPSMRPTLNDDEPVVVNLEDTKIVNGKVYAIDDETEGLRIKRLSRQSDGRILVRSDNPDKLLYPDDYLSPGSTTRIVGRVCYRSGEL